MSELVDRLVDLEADVRYQEPPEEGELEFGYSSGTIPILISAPHGAKHNRFYPDQGKRHNKDEDEFTAGLARLVAEKSGAHVIWLRRKSDQDPNADLSCRYKNTLREIIQEHSIRFVIDIHGAKANSQFDFALGTSRGESCDGEIQDLIETTLEEFGLRVAINPNNYAATGDGTITRYTKSELGVEAAQLEINAHLRVPERRPDASAEEDFKSRNPALIETTVEALADLVGNLAKAV